MKILMIDVGGTNVKLMATGQGEQRKVPSGKAMTAAKMVREVLKATKDWEFDAITIGYPSLVADGKPAREPLNLGGGWLRCDFQKAFGKPVKVINDAAMQALANYQGGRMLFFGLGTSTGAALIVDDALIPLEVGMLCLPNGRRFMERLTEDARLRRGRKKWLSHALSAIAILQDVFKPDDLVLGGGNAKEIDPVPEGCRVRDNKRAFTGAARLWPGADMMAEPYGTSWRIVRKKAGRNGKGGGKRRSRRKSG